MKTKEEILEQTYMTAKDLKILIPNIGINQCRKYISEMIEEEEKKGFFIPKCKTLIIPTKVVRKKFNI